MNNKKLILIGAGGHFNSVLDSLVDDYRYNEIGFVDDDKDKLDYSPLNVTYLGKLDELKNLFNSGWNYAFITIGSIGDNSLRKKLYDIIKSIGFSIPNVFDKSSVISKSVKIGEGVFVGKGAAINAGCKIGDCCIINTNSTIDHDCIVGDFCHVSPGTILCGQVNIGNNSHIGAGSVVKQLLSIGSNTIVGIGSVVTKNIESNCVAYGNPCKKIKDR